MITDFRDNAIIRSHLLLKMAVIWAIAVSLIAIILASFCFYALKHRQIHWLPVCASAEFNLSQAEYSATYLQEMAKKVIDLRLTYSPETVKGRFLSLLHLLPADKQEVLKKMLSEEIAAVREKNISSVFYQDELVVDLGKHQAKVRGYLYRSSHGLQVKPQYKAYLLVFSFKDGVLWPDLIKELDDAKN